MGELATVGEEAIGTVAVSPCVAVVGELAPALVAVVAGVGIGVEGVAGGAIAGGSYHKEYREQRKGV